MLAPTALAHYPELTQQLVRTAPFQGLSVRDTDRFGGIDTKHMHMIPIDRAGMHNLT